MQQLLTSITSKGQVTIPAEIRRMLGVSKNDKIAFVLDKKGNIELKAPKYSNIASLRGAAGSLKKAYSWKKIREIAREDALNARSIR